MKKNNLLFIRAFILSIILVFSLNVDAQEKTASVEGITEYKLKNGLKVLLFPDNSAQTITVNITYKVGSRHEGYGEKGMAHLLEHMIFKGTPNHPDIPKELTARGARPNGTTWYDRTNYFETFNANKENLEWALDLEADRMVNSFIAKKDLESEFSVVRNEFESGENSPSKVLMQKVIRTAFMWHNYGNSTIGNKSDIERVPVEKLKAFYKKYYRPDNAVLMVTGKFENNKMLKLIKNKFAAIKNPDEPLRDIPTIEPAQDGEKRVVLSRVGDLQVVAGLYHTPAGSHEDYAAIAVLKDVLTSQPSGRLYKALIDEKKASSIWSFSPFTKEPSFIYFNVDVPSDKSITEAEKTLTSLLDNLKDYPVTDEELRRSKANLLKQYDQINRNSARLGTYMSEFIGAGDWRLSFIHRDRVEAMTKEKVNAAINRYFINTNRTIGNFVPSKKPIRVEIEHTGNLDELTSNYKGKEGFGSGEAFDVSYDNIQNRLNSGTFEKLPIEYGFIKKDNRGETVTLTFTFRNGSVDDFMNKDNIDNYTVRMLNKGSKNNSRQDIQDKLSAIKSSVNFWSSNGRVTAKVNTTKANLMESLALMTDMLKHPKFDKAELDKLKTMDLANIEKNKTDPQYLAGKKLRRLNQNFKKGHPLYVKSIEEDIAAINDVAINDLQEFYNTFYGISNSATLIAIGNIEEQVIRSYFEKEFSNFKSNKPYAAISNTYKVNIAVNIKIKTPGKKNAISVGVLAFESSQDEKDFAALQVASNIFGGGFLNSRIAGRLRQKDGVSYGAGGRVSVDPDPENKKSSIMVYAIYAPENDAKVQLGFKEEIAHFIKDGITEDELNTAVTNWVQDKNVSRAKDDELSTLINNNLYYDRDLSFQKNIENNITALTVEDVNKVIKKYFKTFDNWTVVNAGDFETFDIKNTEKKVD